MNRASFQNAESARAGVQSRTLRAHEPAGTSASASWTWLKKLVAVLLLLACQTVSAQTTGTTSAISSVLPSTIAAPPVRKNPGEIFPPGSLGYLIWTNFIAHTNGRNMEIWSTYLLPTNFPTGYFPGSSLPARVRPVLVWNTNSLMSGMKGQTAISQCWTSQGNRGQVPITAFTRRHGYTRGHSMGRAGISDHFNGQRVYFCTMNNEVVEAVVQSSLVQIGQGFDYTLLFFSKDLPPGIEPMRVADQKTVFEKYPPGLPGSWIQFLTEQGGSISANFAPFIANTFKAGDSGSPNLLPLPGELVFWSGRSTSGPSPQMQADMDELSRKAGLDPAKYQMQWLDLSSFPTPK